MLVKKKTYSFILVLVLLTIFTASTVMAVNDRIDSVIIDVEGVYVEVDLVEYATAYFEGAGNPLFDYLKGSKDFPTIHAVRSGNKFIDLDEYADNFTDNVSDAIANSDPLPAAQISQFKSFLGFKGDGSPILVGLVPGFNVSLSADEVMAGEEFNIIIENAVTEDWVVLNGNFNVTISSSNADETGINGSETVVGHAYNIIFQDAVSFNNGSATIPMILNEIDDPQYLAITIKNMRKIVAITVIPPSNEANSASSAVSMPVLSVASAPAAGGTVAGSGGGEYLEGTRIPLNANTNGGFIFSHWDIDIDAGYFVYNDGETDYSVHARSGFAYSTEPELVFIMPDQDVSITAYFSSE